MLINHSPSFNQIGATHAPTTGAANGRTHTLSTVNMENGTDHHQYNKSNRSSYITDDESESHTLNGERSGSLESLNIDVGTFDTTDLENDPDLCLKTDEPEAWSVTVDKKIIKKMNKKDVKRQENIFEFINTERNYLTTLKIMQKVYARGLARELFYDRETIDKLFPLIDDHVEYVSAFVQKLTERQQKSKVVETIGDVLLAQWRGASGDEAMRLFGDFCSKHTEIINTYKTLIKNDKKFSAFTKKCDKNPLVRRKGISECAMLVTQRITKYPILLQTLLDNSIKKDHKDDADDIERALELCRDIAKDVDEQVRSHERQQQLMEIYDKTEAKTATTIREGRKFERKDFKKKNRKLLFSSNHVQWKMTKKATTTEVTLVLLSDCIVFLQDNGGKFSFPSGQPAAVPLRELIVREVANDVRGLYLISNITKLMYELKVASSDICKTIMHSIRQAVANSPDEDEGMASEEEEERKQIEQRLERSRLMIVELEKKDESINQLLIQKMNLFKQLAESVDRGAAVGEYTLCFVGVEYELGVYHEPFGSVVLSLRFW